MSTHTLTETAAIKAPLERIFALSTRVELVQQTLGMNLVGGVTTGHITTGSRVLWSGWKFGLPTRHHTLITGFEAPHHTAPDTTEAFFQDTQERGRFAHFHHDHFFRQQGAVTELRDEVFFALPFGPLGDLAARFFLAPHIRRLARQRFAMIKELAETEQWRKWISDAGATPSI